MLICTLFDFGLPMHLTSFLIYAYIIHLFLCKNQLKNVAFIPQASLWVSPLIYNAAKTQVKVSTLPLYSLALPPFLFPERTTIRLSLSRSDLIRFSIAYHRLFYYLFDIQIPSRNSSTRGDSFLSDKVVCDQVVIIFCHAKNRVHSNIICFPRSQLIGFMISK